jgi:hypothetical protein
MQPKTPFAQVLSNVQRNLFFVAIKDRQLSLKSDHLKFVEYAVAHETLLEAIYKSQHASPVTSGILTITHLLLHFWPIEATISIEPSIAS